MPRLTVTDEKGETTEHAVGDKPVTIGRGPACDIVLAGKGVGRLHAVVERSGDKLVVRDGGSAGGGVIVKGTRVDEAKLDAGEEFGLAGYSFRVEADAPSSAARKRSGRKAGRVASGSAGEVTRRGRVASGPSGKVTRRGRGNGATAAEGGEDGEGGEGGEGEGPEAERDRPWRRRQSREVLGGVKLSKLQQTIIKIVCAVIMLVCIALGMKVMTDKAFRDRVKGWLGLGREPAEAGRVIYVDPRDEPRRLAREAKAAWKSADRERSAGDTKRAYDLVCEAKDKVDRSQALYDELSSQYQDEDHAGLQKEAAELNRSAVGIRSDWFRLKQQTEREEPPAGGEPPAP